MNISLLLPTRGRPQLLHRLFDSLVQTTRELRDVEIVLYIDTDDLETQEVSHPALSLVRIIEPPGNRMGAMNTACFQASHGRYVMLINDDLVFRTDGWDERVIETFRNFPDDIALIYGNDLDQGRAVPTFPIVSRSACNVLGEICPTGYHHLHIESHLFDIFKRLTASGHDRIRYLDDVVFEHMHYAVGKAARDSTYKKDKRRLDDLLFIALDDERGEKAALLGAWIQVQEKH